MYDRNQSTGLRYLSISQYKQRRSQVKLFKINQNCERVDDRLINTHNAYEKLIPGGYRKGCERRCDYQRNAIRKEGAGETIKHQDNPLQYHLADEIPVNNENLPKSPNHGIDWKPWQI